MTLELRPPKIAVWFHTRLSGGRNVDSGASINAGWGKALFELQMEAITDSGLYLNSNKLIIGLNGTDAQATSMIVLEGTEILLHGPESESLLPTVRAMQDWLPGHEDWLVLFLHSKGATHPTNQFMHNWRNCLMENLVVRWRRCVTDLVSGNYDAAGCHWTHNSSTDQNAGNWGENSYFAGAMWWATARYLLTLPKVPKKPTCRHDWYKGELVLGCGKPRIIDYHPGSIWVHQ